MLRPAPIPRRQTRHGRCAAPCGLAPSFPCPALGALVVLWLVLAIVPAWSADDAGADTAAAVPAPLVPPGAPVPVMEPAGAPSLGYTGVYRTPSRGSAERQDIMDVARDPVSRALRQTVIFLVDVLRCDDTWCYLQAEPRQPDGAPLDWSTTPFAEEWAADFMSDVVMVLMRRDDGALWVVDYVIGPTDVHWYNWVERYGLPEALFHPRQ